MVLLDPNVLAVVKNIFCSYDSLVWKGRVAAALYALVFLKMMTKLRITGHCLWPGAHCYLMSGVMALYFLGLLLKIIWNIFQRNSFLTAWQCFAFGSVTSSASLTGPVPANHLCLVWSRILAYRPFSEKHKDSFTCRWAHWGLAEPQPLGWLHGRQISL